MQHQPYFLPSLFHSLLLQNSICFFASVFTLSILRPHRVFIAYRPSRTKRLSTSSSVTFLSIAFPQQHLFGFLSYDHRTLSQSLSHPAKEIVSISSQTFARFSRDWPAPYTTGTAFTRLIRLINQGAPSRSSRVYARALAATPFTYDSSVSYYATVAVMRSAPRTPTPAQQTPSQQWGSGSSDYGRQSLQPSICWATASS